MANLTTYGKNLLANWLLTANAATRPTAWYIGVGTGRNAAGLTGEPSGGGYARQQITMTVTGGAAENDADETFGPVSGSAWGLMASIGIFDAVSGGNCLKVGDLAVAKQMDVADTLTIAAGALDSVFA